MNQKLDIRDTLTPEQTDVIKAREYFSLRESRHTIQAIADLWGYATRQSVYDALERWAKSGVLEYARRLYYSGKSDGIEAAEERALTEWPDIVDRMLKIAHHGKSAYTSLEAAKWLLAEVIKPAQKKRQTDEGSAESEYSKRHMDTNPNQIVLPADRIRTPLLTVGVPTSEEIRTS